MQLFRKHTKKVALTELLPARTQPHSPLLANCMTQQMKSAKSMGIKGTSLSGGGMDDHTKSREPHNFVIMKQFLIVLCNLSRALATGNRSLQIRHARAREIRGKHLADLSLVRLQTSKSSSCAALALRLTFVWPALCNCDICLGMRMVLVFSIAKESPAPVSAALAAVAARMLAANHVMRSHEADRSKLQRNVLFSSCTCKLFFSEQ